VLKTHLARMKSFALKLRHILPIYLIIIFSSVIGLLVIRWLVNLQFHLFDIKEEIWEIWIPLLFPWIVILICLRPKLRILNYKDSDKGRFFLQILTWGTMMATMSISQSYLTTSSGKLTHLETPTELTVKEKTKYYKIDRFSAATYYGGVYVRFNTSGKYNNEFNFNVFFVTPILTDSSKEIIVQPNIWYCVEFHKQVSNRLSDHEKQQQYEAFYTECLDKMNHYKFYDLNHFETVPFSDDWEDFSKAVENKTKEKPSTELVLLKPVMEPYENRNKNKFAWIFGAFGIGLGVFLFFLVWAKIDNLEYRRQLEGKKPKEDDLIDAIKYLVPKDPHFGTSIVLDLIILIFLVMFFSGVNPISSSATELLNWGGNRRTEVLQGEWWRLITSMFLHGGLMHLLGNIYGLVIAGLFLEPIIGKKNYFILYFVSGICASLASMCWHENTLSVGASGAIFGLYGALLMLLFTDVFKGGKTIIFWLIGPYVVVNLLLGMTGGIDNTAHIGGLLSGAITGAIIYNFSLKGENSLNIETEN
jgi:rhomboid protease GluP